MSQSARTENCRHIYNKGVGEGASEMSDANLLEKVDKTRTKYEAHIFCGRRNHVLKVREFGIRESYLIVPKRRQSGNLIPNSRIFTFMLQSAVLLYFF